jgi:hypothetical protein
MAISNRTVRFCVNRISRIDPTNTTAQTKREGGITKSNETHCITSISDSIRGLCRPTYTQSHSIRPGYGNQPAAEAD